MKKGDGESLRPALKFQVNIKIQLNAAHLFVSYDYVMWKFDKSFVYFCYYGAQHESFDVESMHEELRAGNKDQQSSVLFISLNDTRRRSHTTVIRIGQLLIVEGTSIA